MNRVENNKYKTVNINKSDFLNQFRNMRINLIEA